MFFFFSFDFIRTLLLEHDIWDQVRVNGGKEFNLICHTQEHIQKFRTNIARKPFRKSKSTDVRALSSFYFNGKICWTLFKLDFHLFFFSEGIVFCMISTVLYIKQTDKGKSDSSIARNFHQCFLRVNFIKMGGIDLRVKLLRIFVISFIFIYTFFIRITSQKEYGLRSTQEWIIRSKIWSITLLLVTRLTWVTRSQDFAFLGFPAM